MEDIDSINEFLYVRKFIRKNRNNRIKEIYFRGKYIE